MPVVREYEVIQERRVTVVATSPAQAIEVANPVFAKGGVDEGDASPVRSELRESSIEARENW